MILPSIYAHGKCSHVTMFMIHALLALCTFSCFFHFIDSFCTAHDKVYYGFVTPHGLAVFKADLAVEVPRDACYRQGLSDFLHAAMSVLVLLSIALSNHRVTGCVFPGHAVEVEEVMESFPLLEGIICNGLFLLFPKRREQMTPKFSFLQFVVPTLNHTFKPSRTKSLETLWTK